MSMSSDGIAVFVGRERAIDPPTKSGFTLLESEAAVPSRLQDELEAASALIVLDALAFPFEALRDVDRSVPMAVRLPDGLDAEGLIAVLGEDLFVHSTVYDAFAVEPSRWGPISARFNLPGERRLKVDPRDSSAVVRAASERFRHDWDAIRQTEVPQGAALGGRLPVAASPTRQRRMRDVKHRLLSELSALRHMMMIITSTHPETRPLRVLEVGLRVGEKVSALPHDVTEYIGFDVLTGGSRELAIGDRVHRIRHLEPHLRLPVSAESIDAFLITSDIATSPDHVLARLATEGLRALRPNGWMVMLCEVVARSKNEVETMTGAKELAALVTTATGQRLVLSRVEAIRLPGEDLYRAGLLAFQRLGAPTRW